MNRRNDDPPPHPVPRTGLAGVYDRLVGPERAVAIGLAADLFGGVWANANPSAVRWYHRPGQGTRHYLGFSAAHLHPFLVARLYRDRDWSFALGNYAYLLAATAAVAGTPPRARRPVALALTAAAIWLNTALWSPTPGLPWFAPVFYLKLLVSHAAGGFGVRDER